MIVLSLKLHANCVCLTCLFLVIGVGFLVCVLKSNAGIEYY